MPDTEQVREAIGDLILQQIRIHLGVDGLLAETNANAIAALTEAFYTLQPSQVED